MVYGKTNPLKFSCLKISGNLDKRIRLGLKHLLAERGRILSGEGHVQGWGADQYGRWIYAVSQAAVYTGNRIPELEEAVKELVSVQGENGFWGDPRVAAGEIGEYGYWPWWGASRALIALTEYWEITRDRDVLHSVKRLGDFYLAESLINPSFYFRGAIEGLVALWRITGILKYLELAEQMANYVITNRLLFSDILHSHMNLLTPLRGFVELFLATGKQQYLQLAQDFHAQTLQHNMWVTGGVNETLGNPFPFETEDEACSVADWLRLSLKLWQATREPKYMEVAEHILLNHLYFDQDHSGGFCSSRSIGPSRSGNRPSDFVAWMCCSMHGLRELLEAAKFIYTHDDESIDVNLFIPSEAEICLKNKSVCLTQITDYPSEFTLRLELKPQQEVSFCLRVRVPRWTRSFTVALNGKPLKIDLTGGYALIKRSWKPGDTVEVSLKPYFRLVPDNVNGFPATDKAPIVTAKTTQIVRINRAALIYGSLVLMVDPVLYPHQMYNWERVEILVPQRENGELFLPKVLMPVPGRGEYSVPEMCFMALGRNLGIGAEKGKCFFNPDQSENQPESAKSEGIDPNDESWKLVFLVPVSEVTDRWTSTTHRMVPYEVRNDVWLLPKNQTDIFLVRTQSLCDSFIKERKLNTTGYAIRLARNV